MRRFAALLALLASACAKPAPRCGNTDCRIFPDARAAFAAVLETKPAALGVGEAHALRGTEGVESATRRFTRDLLPLLSGHATDVIIELLLPNPKCRLAAEGAAREQKVVTERQAATDQDDYVALGTAAKAAGIAPHALEPTCDDLARIAKGGEEAVSASLDVITRLATELATRLVERNRVANDPRLVLLYGGALHNDGAPRPGREQWSFGPALSQRTGGHYTDVDLIVPEFIGTSPAWKAFPWVANFDAAAHADEARLLDAGTTSFVLVFPRVHVAKK